MKTILKTATMALFISLLASCLGGGGGGGSSKSGGTGDGGGEPGGGSSGENICQGQPGEWVQVAVGRVFVSNDSFIDSAERIEASKDAYICKSSLISITKGKKLYLGGSKLSGAQVTVNGELSGIQHSIIEYSDVIGSTIAGINNITDSKIVDSVVTDSDVTSSTFVNSSAERSNLYNVNVSNKSFSEESIYSDGENICQGQPGEWVQVAVGRVFVSSDSSIGPADRIEAYNDPYVCNKSSISVASGKKLYLNGSSLSATQVKVVEENADIIESQISDSLIEGNNYIFKSRIIRSTVKDSDVNASKLSDSTVTDSYLYEVEGSNCSLSGEDLGNSGC